MRWTTWSWSRCGAASGAKLPFPALSLTWIHRARRPVPSPTPAEPGRLTPLLPISTILCGSFHSPAGDQDCCPGLIIQTADLHHGMIVGCAMNEFTIPDVHSSVSDLLGRAAKIEEISGPKVLALNRQ